MFSSSLVLADMDYIAPSQACIKPALLSSKLQHEMNGTVHRHEKNQQHSRDGEGLILDRVEAVKISLQDCLACSGCVTSAETLLVTSQSREELLGLLFPSTAGDEESSRSEATTSSSAGNMTAPKLALVVSLSSQSISSVAAHLRVEYKQAQEMLCRFFKSFLKAEVVVDLTWATALSLRLTADEYRRRCVQEPSRLPLIVSSCPGWVCYCEKQYPDLLPYLCNVMSPQGIAGSILKAMIRSTSQQRVYHVSVQPCFDRKLEAARDGPSQNSEGGDDQPRHTDCVLSTNEVLLWMKDVDGSLESWLQDGAESPGCGRLDECISRELLHPCFASANDVPSEEVTKMLGSGGYHAYVMEHAWRHALASDGGMRDGDGDMAFRSTLSYEAKRNANHRIVRSPLLPSENVIRTAEQPSAFGHLFCVAYGFQHIQNIVRNMRRKTSSTPLYSFIELMACPSGCLNGGGQIRSNTDAQGHEELLAHVTSKFIDGKEWNDASLFHSCGGAQPRDDGFGGRLQSFISFLEERNALPQYCSTVFHDRKKEMEEILNANPLHSLKW